MSSSGERFLGGDASELDLVARLLRGDAAAWRTMVHRYQGRMTAYARLRLGDNASHEDVVQETFISVLQSLSSFRGQCSLETWMFALLRRRIADRFRRDGCPAVISVCDLDPDCARVSKSSLDRLVIEDQIGDAATALRVAIENLSSRMRSGKRFHELMIAEGVFFAAAKNRRIAEWTGIAATEIASRKTRFLDQIRREIRQQSDADQAGPLLRDSLDDLPDDLIRQVWQATRPTCPKRSVLGKYVLGLLPDDWHAYVRFHVEHIRCVACVCSVQEFESVHSSATDVGDSLFRSTINFLHRT